MKIQWIVVTKWWQWWRNLPMRASQFVLTNSCTKPSFSTLPLWWCKMQCSWLNAFRCNSLKLLRSKSYTAKARRTIPSSRRSSLFTRVSLKEFNLIKMLSSCGRNFCVFKDICTVKMHLKWFRRIRNCLLSLLPSGNLHLVKNSLMSAKGWSWNSAAKNPQT